MAVMEHHTYTLGRNSPHSYSGLGLCYTSLSYLTLLNQADEAMADAMAFIGSEPSAARPGPSAERPATQLSPQRKSEDAEAAMRAKMEADMEARQAQMATAKVRITGVLGHLDRSWHRHPVRQWLLRRLKLMLGDRRRLRNRPKQRQTPRRPLWLGLAITCITREAIL